MKIFCIYTQFQTFKYKNIFLIDLYTLRDQVTADLGGIIKTYHEMFFCLFYISLLYPKSILL